MNFLRHITIGLLILAAHSYAFTLSESSFKKVQRIAKSIHTLQPNLSESKYMEYAVGVYKAAKQYQIEPELLVAIAHTETGFREDLPIGKAGEIGICQILRSWAQNTYFKKEFPRAKEKDFWNPEKNFLFAAWLLRDLKNTRKSRAIPYWSYYNAVSFEPRLRYFLTVNKRLYRIDYYGTNVRQPASNESLVPLRADAIRSSEVPATFSAPPPPKKSVTFSWIAQAINNLQTEQRKARKNAFAPTSASLVNVAADLAPVRESERPVMD